MVFCRIIGKRILTSNESRPPGKFDLHIYNRINHVGRYVFARFIQSIGWRDVPKLTMRQHEWKRPARARVFVKQSLSRTVVSLQPP